MAEDFLALEVETEVATWATETELPHYYLLLACYTHTSSLFLCVTPVSDQWPTTRSST